MFISFKADSMFISPCNTELSLWTVHWRRHCRDLVCAVQALLLLAKCAKLIHDICGFFLSCMPNIFSVYPSCHRPCVVLHDSTFELTSLRSLVWIFCVFMEFRSDLHLILDWMTARGCFFDLLSALKILRVNQFPIQRTDLNLNFLKKSWDRHP